MAFSDMCREAVVSSVRLTARALLEGSDCWFVVISLESSSANSRLCVCRGPTAVLSTGKEACEMGVTFQAVLLEWEKYVGVQHHTTHRVTVSTCDSDTCSRTYWNETQPRLKPRSRTMTIVAKPPLPVCDGLSFSRVTSVCNLLFSLSKVASFFRKTSFSAIRAAFLAAASFSLSSSVSRYYNYTIVTGTQVILIVISLHW